MTDEERTKLKAEIVAELGGHLDEHYVKTADLEKLSTGIAEALGGGLGKLMNDLVGSIDDRLLHVEMWVAIKDIRRRIDAADGQNWMWMASVHSGYAKQVRRNVAKWFKKDPSSGLEGVRENLEPHLDKLHQLFRMIDPD